MPSPEAFRRGALKAGTTPAPPPRAMANFKLALEAGRYY